MDCRTPDIDIWATGASIGAFHAAAVTCRFPDVFTRALALSGTYDLRRFYDCGPHEFSDDFWVSSPLFVLADGMGGAQAGEVASQTAVASFTDGLPDGPGSNEERLARLSRRQR